jgi:hypothetical protein
MSKHEEELISRLVRDATPATRRWFLHVVADDELEWRDLSLLETRVFKHAAFWREISQAISRLRWSE